MKLNLIEEISRIKTLISELKGEGATPPDVATGTGTANAGTVKVYTVPSELKNVTDFQNWAVKNGFGSELGPRGADGKYGRYTAAAFAKHKDEYLKQPLPDDEYSVAVDADASDVLANTGVDANNPNANNAQGDTEKDPNDLLSGK